MHGRYKGNVVAEDKKLIIDGKVTHITNHPDAGDITWGDHGVDIVIDATGIDYCNHRLCNSRR